MSKRIYQMTTQSQVRESFWNYHPHLDEQAREAGLRSKRQNEHCATVRCTFVDHVEFLARKGVIGESLAQRVTL